MLETVAKIARGGDRVVAALGALLCVLLLLYGGYSLWDTYSTMRGGFLSGNLAQYKPSGTDAASRASLADLMAINPDVVGWLTVEGTQVDYPFVQGKDNLEYINKDVEGNYAPSGAIFLDSRNSRNLSDAYNLVYGHHMANGAMMGSLDDYLQDSSFLDAHHTGSLITFDRAYTIDFFAVAQVAATDPYVFSPGALSGAEQQALVSHVMSRATSTRDVAVEEGDQTIILSTCAEHTNARTILMGKLVPLEE